MLCSSFCAVHFCCESHLRSCLRSPCERFPIRCNVRATQDVSYKLIKINISMTQWKGNQNSGRASKLVICNLGIGTRTLRLNSWGEKRKELLNGSYGIYSMPALKPQTSASSWLIHLELSILPSHMVRTSQRTLRPRNSKNSDDSFDFVKETVVGSLLIIIMITIIVVPSPQSPVPSGCTQYDFSMEISRK